MSDFVRWLMAYAFYYPLLMSFIWMSGGVIYFLHWERNRPNRTAPPTLHYYPPISLIVPCHNEGKQVRETIAYLNAQRYPSFEIIAVNDGSTDDTAEQLDALQKTYPRLRVIHFASNQGKAMGLRMAAMAAQSEFLVCIDGDALLDEYAAHWLMSHMVDGPRVGAVTGNPRIRNRSTLLGKLQVGEFSSIIGLIKRAQRVYGRIFTVSGVIACFRRSAVHDVGYWNTDMVTEDIDISWRLQMHHWDIRYEPNALCWILMPETLRGLWKQRLRWAQGGVEVILRYSRHLFAWQRRRMWPVALECILSVSWAYVVTGIVVLWLLGKFVTLPPAMRIDSILPQWHGVVLGIVCLLQFAMSTLIDRRYEKRVGRNYYWMIWYPLVYWLLSTATTVTALPKALLKRKGTRAIWVSPDRGIR
jgi:biofilm PGA synthesis N-glycosyltransferase PgaC